MQIIGDIAFWKQIKYMQLNQLPIEANVLFSLIELPDI